jgi:hypothetical protein
MPSSFFLYPFQVGEVLRLKKPHPCGSWLWVVRRTGADIALQCLQCGRMQTMPRSKLEKTVKSVEKNNQEI